MADEGINFRNIAAAVMGLVILAPLLFAAVMWSSRLAPAMKGRLARKAAIAPLVKEARRLGLTYETALADPYGAVGKPAVWCLRRMPEQAGYKPLPGPSPGAPAPAPANEFMGTFYEGDVKRPVFINNPGKVYSIAGSMQQGCSNTLVVIKDISSHDFGAGPRLRLEAEFVDYP